MTDFADILDLLASIVARRGSHIAVEAPDGTLTYDAIDAKSNQVADRLRSLGVEKESRVGLLLPRGALELVAILATMKAGGAYIPLDPCLPMERLCGIIKDADPQVLVLHPGSKLISELKCPKLLLASVDDVSGGQGATATNTRATPEQLAYVLFTSGSTGRPKGVEISRGALANFLTSMARSPGLTEDERLLAITTTSFDIAGLELLLPLCVGATTVIADRETAHDPRKLRQRLEKEDINLLQATPATWRMLLEAGWRGDGKLRMLCGGEALSPALADRLLAAGGELWNVYGPTETTVWSTRERIVPGYDRITIGKPIDETQIYIFDAEMRHVPVGQEGEIWIGGKGLARGYLGRPDLTAERFLDNPHGPPGDRIYRTGDLGRQLTDGRFECLGRLDHQVKIRGFRIELGEIETILRAVPGVLEALVIADRQENGHARLVAYWVGPAGRKDLMAAAQRKLPAYMVPAAYVPLRTLPLNANGKIDRKQLPSPEIAESTRPSGKPPLTEIETRIHAVWTQVLGIKHAPLDQSFFTLGGNSALAIRAAARIEQELQVELPLQAFYASPTVVGLANSIGKKFSPNAPIVARLRQGQPDQAPLLCLLGVTLYQDLALELVEDRPVFGVHVPVRFVPGRESPPTLEHIAGRYVEQIRYHQSHGPYHLLGFCFGGIVAYEVARQLQGLGESVADITVIDAVLPTAIRVDWGRRLRGLSRRAWNRPEEFKRKVIDKLKRASMHLPWLGLAQTHHEPEQAISLPVDGPEADTEVERFAARASKLPARLLVIRATRSSRPDWLSAAPDLGWNGRAATVMVRDVPTSHLGVLRDPYVRQLAQAVSEISRI